MQDYALIACTVLFIFRPFCIKKKHPGNSSCRDALIKVTWGQKLLVGSVPRPLHFLLIDIPYDDFHAAVALPSFFGGVAALGIVFPKSTGNEP